MPSLSVIASAKILGCLARVSRFLFNLRIEFLGRSFFRVLICLA
jgi:hypothetical protein